MERELLKSGRPPAKVRNFRAPPSTQASLTSFEWRHFNEGREGTTKSTPIDLEIGCGVGLHPIRYALAHPERRLIAIEHTRNKFERFAGRIASHQRQGVQLSNLFAIHGNALSWVTERVPPGALSRIFILFPNPNPKRFQANLRWFRMPFFGRLLQSLLPGGEIHLATNIEEYAAEALLYAREVWHLELVSARRFTQSDSPESVPRTHFEKIYLERGVTIFDFVFVQGSLVTLRNET